MTDENVAVALADHENRLKVSEHRLKDLEEQQKHIQDLTISVKELAMSVQNMVKEQAEQREEQKKQAEQIQAIKDAPAQAWTQTKKTFFTAITSSLGTAAAGALIWLLTHAM